MDIFDSNIDVNKYKVFLAVAEFSSFSKAAEYLHISQPAISHSIRELEYQLNTKLFIRNNKSVLLTEEGEKIRYYIRNAFNTISLGEKMLKENTDDLNGVIRIGMYTHISLFMLPDVMKEFKEKYPNAKFSIYCTANEDMLEKLRNNELDFVVLQYPIFLNEKYIKEEVLCKLDTCFYGNKKYYELYANDNKTISEMPIILPVRGFPDISRLEEILKRNNKLLIHNITCYNTELTKKLVKKGLGIGWGIKNCIEEDLDKKELYEIKTDFELPMSIFSIAYDEKILNKTTIEFIKLFKERMKEISK